MARLTLKKLGILIDEAGKLDERRKADADRIKTIKDLIKGHGRTVRKTFVETDYY